MFSQMANTGPVSLLCAGLDGKQREVIGKALQDCMDGRFFICITVILQVDVDGLPRISARRTVGSLRRFGEKRQCETYPPARVLRSRRSSVFHAA